MFLQECFEFLAIQLLKVEFIVIARHIAIFVFVRRGDEQETLRPQYPANLV